MHSFAEVIYGPAAFLQLALMHLPYGITAISLRQVWLLLLEGMHLCSSHLCCHPGAIFSHMNLLGVAIDL
jgi:hypothetical protein